MNRSQWVFAGAAGVAIAWTGWLFYMALTVADPIVVSGPQLHYASLVVKGQVTLEGKNAKVKIIKKYKDDMQVLRQQPLPDTLTVVWSDSYPRPTEQPMLLALIRTHADGDGANYEIAPIPRPDKPIPVVYPFTDSVRIQAERILGMK